MGYDLWVRHGDACLEAGDLACLQASFRFLVRTFRHVLGYREAAEALERFLSCQSEDYVLPYEVLSEDVGMPVAYDADEEVIGVAALETRTYVEARIWIAGDVSVHEKTGRLFLELRAAPLRACIREREVRDRTSDRAQLRRPRHGRLTL